MFAVYLTFYIIIVVINKEENLQHFSESTWVKCAPESGLQSDAPGRMDSTDVLPLKNTNIF